MKAMLERLSEENAMKETHIKFQEEHIAKLLKKLEKGPYARSNKGPRAEEEETGSNRSEASEDDSRSKSAASHGMTHL